MDKARIEIRSARFPDELVELLEGQHRSFGSGSPVTDEEIVRHRRCRAVQPGHRPDLRRVLTVRGRIVSHVLIMERWLRIGSVWVRCGAIGDVWTLPRHRKRGYGARLMEHCVELMTRERFDVSFLFGIPDFYDRFGYATVMPTREVTIPAKAPLSMAAGWSVRPMKVAEIEHALRILRRESRNRNGAFKRSAAAWRQQDRSIWPGRFRSWVILDPRGRIRGYLRLRVHRRHRMELAEIGGLDRPEAVRTALAFAIAKARRAKLKQFLAHLPPDERVERWLRACGAAVKTTYELTGGGSMRILRLGPLMERLRKYLEARLAASPLVGSRLAVDLLTDVGAARFDWSGTRLVIDRVPPPVLPGRASEKGADLLTSRTLTPLPNGSRGAVTRRDLTISLPQMALAPLVFGYCDSAAAAGRYGVTLETRSRRFLDILFPVGRPYVARPDYF